MNSIEAMLVWTPNHPHTEDAATAGEVRVVTKDTDDLGYISSAGACDIGWDEMSDHDRFRELRRLAEEMIEDDNIPRASVYAELEKIDGFRAFIYGR